MSSPKRPKIITQKCINNSKINHLQAKNKSAKTGILVPLNSLELNIDRKNKARPKSRAFNFNRKVSKGKSRLNPFPPKTLQQKVPRGGGTMQHTTETPKRYQCRHIFTDGHRCGSPCLRGEDLCYYHHTTRKPALHSRTRHARRSTFEIPLPEDRSAVQQAIGQVLQRIAANDIDPRRAGLLLYGLQIASLNLPKPQPRDEREPKPETVEEITTDPELGTLAPPAEVGHATERKSSVALLLEKLLKDDKPEDENQERPEPQQPITIPTLQAAENPATHPNPCNRPQPRCTLNPTCRAHSDLRASATGAITRPAESSHASLKPPRTLRAIDLPEPQPKKVAALSFSRNTCKERP
jgi:hypothetical protein